ncbi:hypothetical protein LCGC14_0842870 [marine sediment metagenome]|uniref:Phosphatidic acid phosphatase type 2/haloperoxidase domain-containing protein n=2 Tax=root TaxID=1 RepID=A0A0F9PCJ8_9ZZZZ
MRKHLVQLWLVYAGIISLFAALEIDYHLASLWYQLEGGSWSLKRYWLTQAWLHDGGHDVVVAFYISILLVYILSLRVGRLTPFRSYLSYLSLSIPASTLTVSAIKRLSYVDCPWSVNDFGGERPYQFWLESLWSPLADADHCFPAGHASSAYMLFGLYFVTKSLWPKYAVKVFFSVILLGLAFGIAQQLRGAHFLSHDITTAWVCWTVSYVIWQYWQRHFLTKSQTI